MGQDCAPVDACLNGDRGEEPHGEASLHGGAPAAVAQKSHLIRGNGFVLERRKIYKLQDLNEVKLRSEQNNIHLFPLSVGVECN